MPVAKKRKKRIPQLRHTTNRNIGWHVSYRDPKTGTPKRHRFGMMSRDEALPLYEEWLAEHITGKKPAKKKPPKEGESGLDASAKVEAVPGSILLVASSLIRLDEARTRERGAPRTAGTITKNHFEFRKKGIKDFLVFLNHRHGPGAVAEEFGWPAVCWEAGESLGEFGRVRRVKSLSSSFRCSVGWAGRLGGRSAWWLRTGRGIA